MSALFLIPDGMVPAWVQDEGIIDVLEHESDLCLSENDNREHFGFY